MALALFLGASLWHSAGRRNTGSGRGPCIGGGAYDANLLIVVLFGAVVGALTGLILGGTLSGLYLAVVAGLLGTLVSGVARNEIMKRSGAGPDDSKIPNLVLVYSAIASLAGSALADEVVRLGEVGSPVWLGTLAGLFSCILLAMMMITYYMNPETGRYWKR